MSQDPKIADMRRSYEQAALDRGDLVADPLAQFADWFQLLRRKFHASDR